MAGLRGGSFGWTRLVRCGIVGTVILLMPCIAGAGGFRFEDTQEADNPQYIYRIAVFKWTAETPPVFMGYYNYGYVGEVGMETYRWALNAVVIPEEGNQVMTYGVVQRKLPDGNWQAVTSIDGVWED